MFLAFPRRFPFPVLSWPIAVLNVFCAVERLRSKVSREPTNPSSLSINVPASLAMFSEFFDLFSCAQMLATVLSVASKVVGETRMMLRSQA